MSTEDLAPTEEAKPDVSNAQEMPVEEAVKVIGGTQAGGAPVSEAATAGKALDAVPVGPDPAAAGTAADDTPQDGDYFLDATLADSMQVGLFLYMSQSWVLNVLFTGMPIPSLAHYKPLRAQLCLPSPGTRHKEDDLNKLRLLA